VKLKKDVCPLDVHNEAGAMPKLPLKPTSSDAMADLQIQHNEPTGRESIMT